LTSGNLAGVVPAPYSEDSSLDAKAWELLHVANVFERAGEFDIIHNQADFVPLGFSRLVDTPIVTTIHGFSSARIVPVFKEYEDRVHYVAISDANRHPDLRYAATIHHGIAIDEFPFDPGGSDDLLFFGRIHPDKGAAEAIATAETAGRHLIMAGIVQDAEYYRRHVAPALGRSTTYLGPVGGLERTRVLGSARALLHLINFDEPFGLSVVEALACGTPVIARNRGSMPELITDGVTGFLVNSALEAVQAVERIGELDRRACRAAVSEHFTVDKMADRYLALYQSILQ
jgi:glycosyltransferase involved in cell wall biosynthesis